jgi:hypothetical protein
MLPDTFVTYFPDCTLKPACTDLHRVADWFATIGSGRDLRQRVGELNSSGRYEYAFTKEAK